MSFPKDLLYTKEHEWVKVAGNIATIGITAYAIDQLGDVVHLDMPKAGAKFKAGDTFGTVESTKTVSDLYMPVSGTVKEVNSALTQAPEQIADDPYQAGWIVRIEIDGQPNGLLSAGDYERYVEEGSH